MKKLSAWPIAWKCALPKIKPDELPSAALAESPIYRGGEQLQPWQRSFVTMFLQHRETYGQARMLLADQVGRW